jgi:hypothetical protein
VFLRPILQCAVAKSCFVTFIDLNGFRHAVGEFDARLGWNNGCLSCAHWLHWRTGIDLGAAREKVRVARALPALPVVSAHMRLD